MKGLSGRVEATIPQRQYENIRVTYDFTDEEGRKEAFKCILNDCVKYHNYLNRVVNKPVNVDVPNYKTTKIGDITWRQVDGKWSYFEPTTNTWIKSKKEIEV